MSTGRTKIIADLTSNHMGDIRINRSNGKASC